MISEKSCKNTWITGSLINVRPARIVNSMGGGFFLPLFLKEPAWGLVCGIYKEGIF